MRKSAVTILIASVICTASFAQGVNRTVQVDNDYVSELAGVQKQGVSMSVPDSLLHFDYKFDYSVFETPFKGAYEFSPYSIHVQPDASVYDGSSFWFKAGAGFTMHPVLQFVAAPVVRNDRVVSIYNDGSGFWGRYAGNGLSRYGDASLFNGWDFSDRLGFEGRWRLRKLEFGADARYDVIGAGDKYSDTNSTTHALNVGLSFKPVVPVKVLYDIRGNIGVLEGIGRNVIPAKGFNASLAGTIGKEIGEGRLMGDVLVAMDQLVFDRADGSVTNLFPLYSLTPHYDFTFGIAEIRAGVRLDYTDHFTIAPDVRVSANVLDDRLNLFAGAGGGQSLTDYLSLRSGYHMALTEGCVNGVSYERVHVYAGFDSYIGHTFQYGLKAGYRNFGSTPSETLTGYVFNSIEMGYATAKFALKTERIDFDGNLNYTATRSLDGLAYFAAPMFSGDARFVYNWNRRIYAGVWAQGQTSRRGHVGTQREDLPAFVNLGVSGEFKVSQKFGFWVEGGNLLGMDLWRNPVCAETDPYFTAGICLKFQ